MTKSKKNDKTIKSTPKVEKNEIEEKENKDVKKVFIEDEVKVQKPKTKKKIDKKEIQKIVIIMLGIAIFFTVIFFISEKITGCDFGNFCSKVEKNKKEENPLLAEGEELDENKMKELTEITYEEYKTALKDKKNSTVIYLASDSSYWTQYETPILKSVAYEYDLDVKYLNYDELSEDEINAITKLDASISKETPAILIVKNKKLVASKTTTLTISGFVEFLKENKIISEE